MAPASQRNGVIVPLALVGVMVAGFFRTDEIVFSVLVQLMYITVGWHYVNAATGAVDFLKEAHTDNLTPYQAEHEKCVLLANSREQYAPIELIRLG